MAKLARDFLKLSVVQLGSGQSHAVAVATRRRPRFCARVLGAFIEEAACRGDSLKGTGFQARGELQRNYLLLTQCHKAVGFDSLGSGATSPCKNKWLGRACIQIGFAFASFLPWAFATPVSMKNTNPKVCQQWDKGGLLFVLLPL